MVAAEQCSRYHIDGNSLVIRDVAEEDAGKYTVLVRIQEHGLHQNLTLTLVVNGEKHSPPSNHLSVDPRRDKAVVTVCVCDVCVGMFCHSESSDRGESCVFTGPGLGTAGEQTSTSLHIPRGPASTHPVALAPLPIQRPVSTPKKARSSTYRITSVNHISRHTD